jgi:DNA sulfur modification protein DndE
MTKNYCIILFIITILAACNRPTPVLYLIGDSTMADKPDLEYPERGWGQLLPSFFDSNIIIENHAKNGRSTRSFIYEGRWDSILSTLKQGDFVVMQFGHNDGAETKVGRHATPEEYRYNLSKFVRETLNKGAQPIICTPVARRKFVDGTLTDTHGVYPDIAREIATDMKVPLIDMHQSSLKLLAQLGEDNTLSLFLQIPPGKFEKVPEGKIDNTHFSEKGAIEIASLFVNEINKQNIALVKYLTHE